MAELKLLNGRNGKILGAVMNAIIPRGGAFAPGAADCNLLPRADEILMSYAPMVRSLIPLMLVYIQLSAVLRFGRVFTSLDEQRGGELLSALENSRFFHNRLIMLLMKLVTMLAFYEKDDMAAFTGYTHGCTEGKMP